MGLRQSGCRIRRRVCLYAATPHGESSATTRVGMHGLGGGALAGLIVDCFAVRWSGWPKYSHLIFYQCFASPPSSAQRFWFLHPLSLVVALEARMLLRLSPRSRRRTSSPDQHFFLGVNSLVSSCSMQFMPSHPWRRRMPPMTRWKPPTFSEGFLYGQRWLPQCSGQNFAIKNWTPYFLECVFVLSDAFHSVWDCLSLSLFRSSTHDGDVVLGRDRRARKFLSLAGKGLGEKGPWRHVTQ